MRLKQVLSFIWNDLLFWGALAVLVVFVALHVVWYIRPSDVKSAHDVQAQIGQGQPVVVEFYTNL